MFTKKFPEPPIVSLLDNWPAAPWLVDQANGWAASPVAMIRAAAVGLIGRLADAETTDPTAALAARLNGDDGPAFRARVWAGALGEGPLRVLVASMLGEASRLIEDIETLADLTDRAGLALSIRERRDELECAAFVVRWSDVGLDDPELREAVYDALAEIDRTAAEYGVLNASPSESSRWLRAVGWQEPDSWWGDINWCLDGTEEDRISACETIDDDILVNAV